MSMNSKTTILGIAAIAIVLLGFGFIVTFSGDLNLNIFGTVDSDKPEPINPDDYNPNFIYQNLDKEYSYLNESINKEILVAFIDIAESFQHYGFITIREEFPDAELYTLIPEDLGYSLNDVQEWLDGKSSIDWQVGIDTHNSYQSFFGGEELGVIHVNKSFQVMHLRAGEVNGFRLSAWVKNLRTDFPGILFTAMNGTIMSTWQSYGKVIIIDFWATWCGPCGVQMEDLAEVYAEYSEVCEIYSISTDLTDSLADIQDYASSRNMNWIVGSDTMQVNNAYWNVTAIPTLYVLDTEFNIVAHHVGTTSASTLSTIIENNL